MRTFFSKGTKAKGNKWSIVHRLLFLTLLISQLSSLLSLPLGEGWGGAVQAQGVYKQSYIYAHTFETGISSGVYRNDTDKNCVKFSTFEGTTRVQTNFRSVPAGDKDGGVMLVPYNVTVSAETTGSIASDDSFDGGLFSRCFAFFKDENATHGRIKLTNQFLVGSNPKIRGVYFEAGHVNMDGSFVINSQSQYRLIIKSSTGIELFNSGVLNNAIFWNKFYVPLTGVNTTLWAGNNITFEIRAWTNSATGSQVFRFDDIGLIGSTACVPSPGKIGNLVWEDTNGDGTADAAEPKLAGVCVDLLQDDGDGIFDATKDLKIASTVTDASGNYLFDDLFAGKYYVSIGVNKCIF